MSAPIVACSFIVSNSAGGQLVRLVEDVFGDRELAGVVQQRGGFERPQLQLVLDVQLAREPHGVFLHAPEVIVRDLIAGVHGLGERFDRRRDTSN